MLVYVASIDNPYLLGLDFLKKSSACLNFGDMMMSVCGDRMPLLEDSKCVEVVVVGDPSVVQAQLEDEAGQC